MELMARVECFEAFCRRTGGTTTADVQGHIHAGLRSAPTTKSYKRFYEQKLARLQDERDRSRAAFLAAIEAGEIAAPDPQRPFAPAKVPLEELAARDDERGEAARRVLAKRAARSVVKRRP